MRRGVSGVEAGRRGVCTAKGGQREVCRAEAVFCGGVPFPPTHTASLKFAASACSKPARFVFKSSYLLTRRSNSGMSDTIAIVLLSSTLCQKLFFFWSTFFDFCLLHFQVLISSHQEVHFRYKRHHCNHLVVLYIISKIVFFFWLTFFYFFSLWLRVMAEIP